MGEQKQNVSIQENDLLRTNRKRSWSNRKDWSLQGHARINLINSLVRGFVRGFEKDTDQQQNEQMEIPSAVSSVIFEFSKKTFIQRITCPRSEIEVRAAWGQGTEVEIYSVYSNEWRINGRWCLAHIIGIVEDDTGEWLRCRVMLEGTDTSGYGAARWSSEMVRRFAANVRPSQHQKGKRFYTSE